MFFLLHKNSGINQVTNDYRYVQGLQAKLAHLPCNLTQLIGQVAWKSRSAYSVVFGNGNGSLNTGKLVRDGVKFRVRVRSWIMRYLEAQYGSTHYALRRSSQMAATFDRTVVNLSAAKSCLRAKGAGVPRTQPFP